ncbi:MAG: thiamine pyrophosphate-dependent enzyme [Candidatus Hodarchaeales archaeon]|jgi:2-oxoglutarate ferredoxin oxidoreductase subunit beta
MTVEIEIKLTANDYASQVNPTWCPGCGDYAVLKATQRALAELQVPNHEVFAVSGIGCSSNFPHFLKAYGVHSLHGRAIPVATGAALANHRLKVIVAGGDGDGYGIGAGHFLHACRRNVNLTYLAMNNQIYGLTTGQASPTSELEMITKSTPGGVIETPINPLPIAISAGASFVARGFSGDVKFLTELFKAALQHKGFALVDVLSPCVTFNKLNTYPWFKKRVYRLDETNHNSSDLSQAMNKAIEWPTIGDKIPTGIFYQVQKPTYDQLEPTLQIGPLVDQKIGIKDGSKLFEPYY